MTTVVLIFFLLLLTVLIVEISKSPKTVNPSVLGIGVADKNKASTQLFSSNNLLRALTPKRCCSSIITNPKFL